MAKWGEGDPRWIVEERPDATNVNNWHWTEKNATAWSKERLQQLLGQISIEQNDNDCEVTGFEKCNGEATANNRKGKLIFFYEWDIVLKWTGRLGDSDTEHTGKITIPNLSEENNIDDVEITITVDTSSDESEKLKEFMYEVGRKKIRAQLALYIKELKEEYSKNLILPKKDEVSAATTPQESKNNASIKTLGKTTTTTTSVKNENSKNNGEIGCKLDVKTLTMTEKFQCSANDLYNALTKADMLSAFTRSPVKVDPVRGGEFSLYGGNVVGRFEELVPEKKIAQTWKLKNWPSGHYSNVVLELEETTNNTILHITQTGIPASEFEAMKTNWNRYYWNSIKQTFGFGVALF